MKNGKQPRGGLVLSQHALGKDWLKPEEDEAWKYLQERESISHDNIALFDFDNTLYQGHSFFEYLKLLVDKNVVESEVYERVIHELKSYKSGEKSYTEAASRMLEIGALGFKGKSYDDVYDVIYDYFDDPLAKYYEFSKELVVYLSNKFDCYLVTTNIDILGHVIKNVFGMAGYISSIFETKDGMFTGKILKSLASGKEEVRSLVEQYRGRSIAFGDSENDIGMLEAVDIAVCVNPSEILKKEAEVKGWLVCDEKNILEKVKEVVGEK